MRERNILPANQGPGPQPRHVPWPGTEPVTFWFIGWHSTHWALSVFLQGWFGGDYKTHGPQCHGPRILVILRHYPGTSSSRGQGVSFLSAPCSLTLPPFTLPTQLVPSKVSVLYCNHIAISYSFRVSSLTRIFVLPSPGNGSGIISYVVFVFFNVSSVPNIICFLLFLYFGLCFSC